MMSARMTSGHVRHVIRSSIQIRHATSVQSPVVRRLNRAKSLGQQIYVFNHIQTNQVVYSLTKALKNNAALKQIPFNGKKTVPRALRKDVWSPLATISFAPGATSIGLSAFQKLREYKRLHELQWDDSLMTNEEGIFIPKKKRGRQISNQKANSIADIATVLGKIGTPEGEEIGLKGAVTEERDDTANWTKVEVKWINMLDAEFAETWSDNVVHDELKWEKNNRDPESWERRKEALKAARRAEKGAGVSAKEKADRQMEYWAELEMQRELWYLEQGKSLDEIPPRKIYDPALVTYTREEKLAALEAYKKREQEVAEKDRKQREYWANLDKKRQEWYLEQGKSSDDVKPRKDIVGKSSVEKSSRQPVPLASPALFRMLRKLEEKKRQQDDSMSRKIAHVEKLVEIDAKQTEYWANLDKKRQEWYLAQGKSLDEIPPRTNAQSARSDFTTTLQELNATKLAKQTMLNQEIARVKKLMKKDLKRREICAEQNRRRVDYYLLHGKSLVEVQPRRVNLIPRIRLPLKSARQVRTRAGVLSRRALQKRKSKDQRHVDEGSVLVAHKPEQVSRSAAAMELSPEAQGRALAIQVAKEEKQKAFWAEVEAKRVEWYASQGKGIPPPRKEVEKNEVKRGSALVKKFTSKKKSASNRPLSQEEQKAKEAKQKAYWAEMEKKRVQWYASQGKTPPEKGSKKVTL